MTSIQDVIDDFDMLDDWEDRYRYLIELGQTLEPMSAGRHSQANKVRGCVSQVWLETETVHPPDGGEPILSFTGDSDAHIVRGLIAVLFAIFSGKTAREILNLDAADTFRRLSLQDHLTPQRSNGFAAMVKRIRNDANMALEGAETV